jgi:endonuclease/exonuclease/phosphatase family metal-dependent hydrolase
LRVATYNLLHGLDVRSGRDDLDGAAEAIAGLDADVVAVQEVDRGLTRSGECDQIAELAARLDRTGIFVPALLGDPTARWARGPGRSRRPIPTRGGRPTGSACSARCR